jgi:dTMP kinase
VKGKLIVIEGTDCSGKETQSKILIDRLNKENIKTEYFSFPNYSSPSGKIVGLSFLGKSYLAHELVEKEANVLKEKLNDVDPKIIDKVLDELGESLSKGWFPETAPNVPAKVASLYYAADRLYNLDYINEKINNGTNLILDRYFYSNMAHQAGKLKSESERSEMYEWLYDLEVNKLELPDSSIKLFLHMPTPYINLLKSKREEKLDENEKNVEYLENCEKAYLELVEKYEFERIECVENKVEDVSFENIKTPAAISDEIYKKVKQLMK